MPWNALSSGVSALHGVVRQREDIESEVEVPATNFLSLARVHLRDV